MKSVGHNHQMTDDFEASKRIFLIKKGDLNEEKVTALSNLHLKVTNNSTPEKNSLAVSLLTRPGIK